MSSVAAVRTNRVKVTAPAAIFKKFLANHFSSTPASNLNMHMFQETIRRIRICRVRRCERPASTGARKLYQKTYAADIKHVLRAHP